MTLLSTVHWYNPTYSLFLPISGIVFIMMIMQILYRRRAIFQLAGLRIYLFQGVKNRLVPWLKTGLATIGMLCLLIALMRPQCSKDTISVTQQVRDVFIALDISRSMLARDMGSEDRLTFAKKKIKSLIAAMPCERIGLILFSGTAFTQCPLTTDHSSFHLFLDAVDVESVSAGSTAVDQAIKKALIAFDSVPNRKSKVLILFTDGEDFSTDLATFRQQALDKNLSLFAYGVGSVQGAPIPIFDQSGQISGHQKDSKNAIVVSRLNDTMLKTLAQELGGFYCTSTNDNNDIRQLASAVDRFEKDQLSEKKRDFYNECYHYFLLAGFASFVLEWLL